jgi:hypothetical protein
LGRGMESGEATSDPICGTSMKTRRCSEDR